MTARPTSPPPARWEFLALRLWHAALAGGFVVAYVTADEDTYSMHVFSGYWVITALVLRLVMALAGSDKGPLRLPRPSLAAIRDKLAGRPGRNPLFAWMAGLLLPALALGGLSGVIADVLPAAEDLHEGLAEAGLWLVLAHAAIIAWIFQGRRIREYLAGGVARVSLLGLLALPALGAFQAQAGEPARDAILAAYARQASGTFSAERGEALYRSKNTASPDFASCATCHTADPTQPGRHAKTGRTIPPAAVSANPKRFTDAAKVEERFDRDCQTVLGRACTALEKGDYITFLTSK
jgi:cytochrome b561